MPIRNIVDSLHKYENYQIGPSPPSAFLTVFAATMGNTWSARFMTGWVSRPHHLHGVGRPTPVVARHRRFAKPLPLSCDWTNPTTVSMQKKSDSIANGNDLLPNSASSNPCRKRWRCPQRKCPCGGQLYHRSPCFSHA